MRPENSSPTARSSLNLIGQDTTSYGDDIGRGFNEATGTGGLPDLLRAVNGAVADAGGHGWVRLMYAYPSNFRDEFIDAFAEALTKRARAAPTSTFPPARQPADARTHAPPRRREAATRTHAQAPRPRARHRDPHDLHLRLPGETQADHEQLLEFIEEVGFDAVGVFEYSKEPGTPAGTMEEDPKLAVPHEVKAERPRSCSPAGHRLRAGRVPASQWDEKDPLRVGRAVDILIDRDTGSEVEATAGVSTGGKLYGAGRTTGRRRSTA